MKAKVYISYKEGILDPQGKTVGNALQTMDLKGISDVRIGKYIEVSLDTESRIDAENNVKIMCEELLANPVIERYTFEIMDI